jgi:hypothetical protein
VGQSSTAEAVQRLTIACGRSGVRHLEGRANSAIALTSVVIGRLRSSSASFSVDQLGARQSSFKIVVDLRQKPLEPVRLGFIGQYFGM